MSRYFVASLVSTLRVARTKRNQVMMLMTGVKLSGEGLSISHDYEGKRRKKRQNMKKKRASDCFWELQLQENIYLAPCFWLCTDQYYISFLAFFSESVPNNLASDLARRWTPFWSAQWVVGIMSQTRKSQALSARMQSLSNQYQVRSTQHGNFHRPH